MVARYRLVLNSTRIKCDKLTALKWKQDCAVVHGQKKKMWEMLIHYDVSSVVVNVINLTHKKMWYKNVINVPQGHSSKTQICSKKYTQKM